MIRLAVVGAAGRMGTKLLELADAAPELTVTAALVGRGEEPRKLGPRRIESSADIGAGVASCDVVIDFSQPAGFDVALASAVEQGKPFVSGTTGLSEEQFGALDEAAASIPVLWAANFSIGVNVLGHLTELASRALQGFDVEIFEAHHRRKVDAPSGTALYLGRAAAKGRGVELDDVAEWTRHGQTGARTDDEIGFQVLRGGSVVGEHTVFFCGAGERVEITHRAEDRAIFAQGALRAAQWLAGRGPGRYAMSDVLFG